MAVLSKIRERSMILIVIIGMALFAFVASPKDIINFFTGTDVNVIGTVDGEKIDREEFGKKVENYKKQLGGRLPNGMFAVNNVWNSVVREMLYNVQIKEAGIVVGSEDIWARLLDDNSIKNSDMFKDELGVFSENMLKEYLATMQSGTDEQSKRAWFNWLANEKNIEKQLLVSTYDDLIQFGLGSSLKAGEIKYKEESTTVDADIVFIPYRSINDSLVEVSDSEVKSYISKHAQEYKQDARVNLKYVVFENSATDKDKEDTQSELNSLRKDREEYSSISKSKVTVLGLENTTDYEGFLLDNSSDLESEDILVFKNDMDDKTSELLFSADKNTVVGPYEQNGYFKLSKVVDILQSPDSAAVKHVLIGYVGSRSQGETRTKEEAKELSDSLLVVLKSDFSKFDQMASDFSADKSSSEKGGELELFAYKTMVSKFRDFCFGGSKGDLGIAETKFGYHIIKITEQKNTQKALKLVTISRKIEASEATENAIYESAETFAYNLINYREVKINALAKKDGLKVKSGFRLGKLDSNVSSLGEQRNIVKWAYNEDTKVGDSKRFDIEKGYVVVSLSSKTSDGTKSVNEARSSVVSKLRNEKKAEMLKEKMNGSDLETIAKENDLTIKKLEKISFKSGNLSGIGREIKVVGALFGMKEGSFEKMIVGSKGLFAVKLNKINKAEELESYETYKKTIMRDSKSQVYKVYKSLEEASDIKDNRALFF
ncbi:MAG: peptidylprolyl isomerase [Flavobacteriaceae bacterium]|nr:peptidylprolyl isomerase [Flavobacteriaceae bacterium]